MVRLGLCINWVRSPRINGQVGCNSRVLLAAFMGTALGSQPKDYQFDPGEGQGAVL